ncbi:GMC oxidoreductase [Bailinhaonella thermotolerans]|uniref:Cholesterol oxidase n=1 Tax=Bailinhaonella thermotolerans TaxID=1070861 RepID=A0A3A4ABI6_9ACTN|nr:GMC family oxidoreductase [Bailinhaonella thermotolerans]RJL24177.1 GMC family oxidoreductase [Bailinhaonella thermotolerans]
MREHVDAVVVGSGFGGAVTAYRLAEGGKSVVVLERGDKFAPGDFPRSRTDMSRAFWDPKASLYGMFDVWSFDGLDSVVSSGLGGGSLIYANVLMRKDERWFVHEQPLPGGGYENWPVSRAELDPHYDEVERMLGGTPYPLDRPAYARAGKTHVLQDAAAELGLSWHLPKLAVSFAPSPDAEPALGLEIAPAPYGNLHGDHIRRFTCRLCGECDIGCNDGAKNSLDHTYLSAAQHHGADLRELSEVRAIRPRHGGGYEVEYVRHDKTGGAPDPRTITCDRLVLAAGTLGTTYLLLRNRKALPGLSDALGTRFSGNGDLLTFLLNTRERDRLRPLDASRGPVITSAIRLPDEADGFPGAGRGAYIQDGGYPAFADWITAQADVGGNVARMARFLLDRFREFISGAPDTNLSQELSELIGQGALSVSSLPLLGMGRDTPDGVLALRDGRLDVAWTTQTSEQYFERVRETMRRIADVLGAEYKDNPMWFLKRIITVHPVGGAPIGRHPGEGVADPFGEVYGHPGLYVADAAAMPGPVGVNPSLTIAAMANRLASRILEPGGTGQAAAARPAGGVGDDAACDRAEPEGHAGQAGRTSLSFTEEMKGHYRAGAGNPSPGSGEPFSFRLTITADDVDRFLAEPDHLARAEGWIESAVCGGRRRVEAGWFNLFAPGGAPDRRLMRYRLHFTDADGRLRTLSGWKNVFHGPPTDIWADTSTLFFRLLEGHVAEGKDEEALIVGAGTLRIELVDFIQQLTTFRTEGPKGLSALERFARFFVGELWDVYGPAKRKVRV